MSDEIQKTLREIQKAQAEQHLETTVSLTEVKEDLKYHIKRTDLIQDKLDPIEHFYIVARGLFRSFKWVLGILSTLAGLIWVISKLL